MKANKTTLLLPFLILFLYILSSFSRAPYKKVFIVHAKDFDLVNAPVYADISTNEINEETSLCLKFKGGIVPAQVEKLADSRQRVWWIANLKAGQTMKYTLSVSDKCRKDLFTWKAVSDYSMRLSKGNQPVIQYEHPVFDSKNILTTHKPFHHVFDPSGDQFITKGR